MSTDKIKSVYAFDKELLDSLREEVDPDDNDSWGELRDSQDCEIEDAIQLIHNNFLSSNIFNSSDWIKECQERLKEPETPTLIRDLLIDLEVEGEMQSETNLPPKVESNFASVAISEAWERLESDFQRNYEEEKDAVRKMAGALPSTYANTPADFFTRFILSGHQPPPEILLSVAYCFELYKRAGGKISLEEAFFGKPKKRQGNYGSQTFKDELFRHFHDTREREEVFQKHSSMGLKPVKLISSAETLLDNLVELYEIQEEDIPDVETFLRGYRRWKKTNAQNADK